MKLEMYLKDELLESVEIDASLVETISALKMNLEDKHSDIIILAHEEPEYFITEIPSRINKTSPFFTNFLA